MLSSDRFSQEIAQALGLDLRPEVRGEFTNPAQLASVFDVAGLARASMAAAGAELAALTAAQNYQLDERLALMWFNMTLRPKGWQIPAPWDPIAGDYPTKDGWIRLHTNAPRHRDAALKVLGAPPQRADVAARVLDWSKEALEAAIVTANGAAAAMRTLSEWQAHEQGLAVAREPLILWQEIGIAQKPANLRGLRVLDLTRVLAGPVATRFLAGFGAQILRIDPPDWNEPGVEPEVTLGKRCAGLDLRQSDERKCFEKLLKQADVLVHGYRTGALAGLGYDDETLTKLAPNTIRISLNAYGHEGPWCARRGFDSLVQMSTGIAAEGQRFTNSARPLPLPVQALDHATGYLMAAAALRALRLRAQQGVIFSAKLSLARVAQLLIAGGAQWREADIAPESPADLAPELEATLWGPAQRLAFPLTLAGQTPQWRYPAGPLRSTAAQWCD